MGNLRLNKYKKAYYPIMLTLILLCIIGVTFWGTSILFIIKIPITKINFIIFPCLTVLIIKIIAKKSQEDISWKILIISLVIFYIISILLAIICNFVWDYSYDSLSYHQEGVIRLANGWNPFYESTNAEIDKWVMHYAKAPWIFAATIVKITSHVESGKILSIFIPLILGVFSFGIFYIVTKKRTVLSIILAVLLVINPVNIGQSFTYYVDSLLGCYIIFLLLILYLIIFTDGFTYFKYFALFNIAIFMCNIKFTGLAYAMGILGMYFIYVLFTDKTHKKMGVFTFLLISLIITVIIVGFNPYVTNTINKGNPLYPLAGEGKIDIMINNTPEFFRYDNEFEKSIKSLLAYPTSSELIMGKNMFHISKNTLAYYSGADARIRGFGLYSTIFLPITFIAMVVLLITCKNKKIQSTSILALIGLTAVTLYGGSFWWARYVAYIWFFPIIVVGVLAINKRKFVKYIGYTLIVLIFVNCAMILPVAGVYKLKKSNNIKNYIFNSTNPLEITRDVFFYSYENKAKEYNIDYIFK